MAEDKKPTRPTIAAPTAPAADPALEQQPASQNAAETLTSAQIQQLAATAGPDYDPDAILQQASQTSEDAAIRRESQPKAMRGFDQISPAARIARQTADVAQTPDEPLFMFISPYRELRLYVNFGHVEREKTGAVIPRHYAIQFRNGVFTTKSESLAQKLREHRRFGTRTFREELNAQAVAIRAATAAARQNMRAPTFAGPSTSADGAEGVFHHQDHELAAVEQRLFEL